MRDNVRWEANGALYFEGEEEPCINGIALASGAYFGQDVERIVSRLLADELDDGGWNCWAPYGATVSSFHSTLCVLEGLLEWEQRRRILDRSHDGASARRGVPARTTAVPPPVDGSDRRTRRFTMFSFPPRWYYDVLRALEYFRRTGEKPDDRIADAVALVADRRERGRPLAAREHAPGPDPFRDGERRLPQPLEHAAGVASPPVGGLRCGIGDSGRLHLT